MNNVQDGDLPSAATLRGAKTRPVGSLALLALSYIGFISLGLPDAVLGIAWPSVRDHFELTQKSLGLASIALGSGYLISSFLSGKMAAALGTGGILTVSTGLVAAAMFGNAVANSWAMFLSCAVIWGLGSGGIDAGLNAFVASHFPPRHVNYLHACYSLGATCGPLLMTAFLFWAGSWRLGYVAVASVMLVMTVLFVATFNAWNQPGQTTDAAPSSSAEGLLSTLRVRAVWLLVALFFLYTGLELLIGQWAFTILTESRRWTAPPAGVLVAVYFGSIGVGRVGSGMISELIGLDRLLRWAMILAALSALVFALKLSDVLSVIALAGLGLGLAPVFPCLMARTPERLGKAKAQHSIGFQVAGAMVGGAAIPGLGGLLAQSYGLEAISILAVSTAAVLCVAHEALLRRKSPLAQES